MPLFPQTAWPTSGPSIAAGSVIVIMTSLTSSIGMSPITRIRLASSRVNASGIFRFSPEPRATLLRPKQWNQTANIRGLWFSFSAWGSGRRVMEIERSWAVLTDLWWAPHRLRPCCPGRTCCSAPWVEQGSRTLQQDWSLTGTDEGFFYKSYNRNCHYCFIFM